MPGERKWFGSSHCHGGNDPRSGSGSQAACGNAEPSQTSGMLLGDKPRWGAGAFSNTLKLRIAKLLVEFHCTAGRSCARDACLC